MLTKDSTRRADGNEARNIVSMVNDYPTLQDAGMMILW